MALVSERFDKLGLLPDGSVDSTRAYRLGIMGGTFDPIHIGHLAVAEQARVAFDLDAVLFIPTGNPVFKRDKQVTDAQLRVDMCLLACRGNRAFDVSTLEVDRGGDTYTVDTLRTLRSHYPENVELFFIMGGDAALSLSKWRNVDEMAELAEFIATARPGYRDEEGLARIEADHPLLRIHHLDVVALDVSSSMLRSWVAQGRSIRYLTPLAVCEYIKSRNLYRESER